MKMLKLIFILPIMACILFLSGCDTTDDPVPIPTLTVESAGTIAEFFPFHENTVIVFDDTGPWGQSTFYTVYTDGNRMQRRATMGSFIVTEVFEIADGELRVNHASVTSSGFEPLLDKKDEAPMIILKEPLELGNSWETHTGPTIQGVARGTSTITAVDVEIDTPCGVVSAIEVSREFEDGRLIVDYFAKGLGLVQSGYFVQGFERDQGDSRMFMEDMLVHLSLRSITENAPLDVELFLIFPNDDADDLDFAEITFSFMTNGDIIPAFETAFRNPAGRPYGLISQNTEINSIDVSWRPAPDSPQFDMTTVHLDLSADFANDMNVGALLEQLILESLEFTMIEFFNAHEFILTVDGQPHISSH